MHSKAMEESKTARKLCKDCTSAIRIKVTLLIGFPICMGLLCEYRHYRFVRGSESTLHKHPPPNQCFSKLYLKINNRHRGVTMDAEI